MVSGPLPAADEEYMKEALRLAAEAAEAGDLSWVQENALKKLIINSK